MSAQNALGSLLLEMAVDFANIIEINEENDVYHPPSPWRSMTARCGSPVSDSTALMYNSALWAPVENASTGCMDDDDRSFIVQTFEHTGTSEKVIFAGAHFPHGAANEALKNAVTELSNSHPDALGVVLAADTNREGDTSTASILRSIVESEVMTTNISVAQLFPTCCYNDGFIHDYDRIGATLASDVSTKLLFNPAPSWVNVETPSGEASEFHKALVATFQLVGGGEAQSEVVLM